MTFFERYAAVAEKKGLKPGSEKAASLFGSSKSTVSKWKTGSITPIGSVVADIADAFGVSTDYLLGRTDDMTDYAKGGPQDAPAPADDGGGSLATLISRLDAADRLRAEGVIQGMLMQEKYVLPDAAHARTDINATPEMVAHDESIMDSDEF